MIQTFKTAAGMILGGAGIALGMFTVATIAPLADGPTWSIPISAVPVVTMPVEPVSTQEPITPDPFFQENFPCQEDEVLGYSPAFGPDQVGCIHIDVFNQMPPDPRYVPGRLGGALG